ncbi:MAG: beta-ketoacyl-ACP synthase II [Deltaproteobacteria bacterium]|nr:beta-ketoacyl-ACP synthase II [Deltaproteobacteria bacterium]
MSERRIVITGMGIICPVGNNLRTTWENITNGKSGVGSITTFDAAAYPSRIAGEIKDFDPKERFSHADLKRQDRYSLVAMVAADEALMDAGLDGSRERCYAPSRMGTILGVGIGGLLSLEENHRVLIASGPRKVSPFLIPRMISNLAPGNIAIKHNLKGVNYTVTSACTSGTHALGEAWRMIKEGLQDVVVTGGAEAAITHLALAGFGNMKALSTRNDEPERASRPFDRDRDGFVMGEGAGVVVLEDLESARKRGANIYAEVIGYGFSCDAFHITAPSEDGEGARSCMTAALRCAGLNPEDVNYINAHGTSTPVNDPAETQAIKSVFGEHAKRSLLVSSTKSMTGHLLGAAGGVEAVFSAMALKTGIVPPTINLDNPAPECDLDYVPKVAREVSIQVAMSNSFGFGGTNASVILRRI